MSYAKQGSNCILSMITVCIYMLCIVLLCITKYVPHMFVLCTHMCTMYTYDPMTTIHMNILRMFVLYINMLLSIWIV